MLSSSKIPFLKRKPRGGRNEHLRSETQIRSKRILTQASSEAKAAFSVYDNPIEYYRVKRNGKACTCSETVIENTVISLDNLQDFLLDSNLNLPTDDFCPLCFGTKLVGGYNRIGSNQLVLDYTEKPKVRKLSLIKDQPYYYKPSNTTGKLTWKVTIPTYFSKAEIAISWKEAPSYWKLTIDGVVLSEIELLNNRGRKVSIVLEMRDSSNENTGFYGIFCQFSNDTIINCDMPRHTISYTGELNIVDEVASTIAINFDSTISDPSTLDLIVDKYGLLWRIIEIEKNNPAEVNITSNCQARLVRRFEKGFQIPSKSILINYRPNYTFI